MTKINEIYKCDICGNIVEVVNPKGGTLVCCNKPMRLLEGNTVDAAVEKHVPVVECTEAGIIVKVGQAPHVMTPEHYIQWIEVITPTKVYRKYLTAEDKPEAVFSIDEDIVCVREYCNLHGLWKA